MANQHQVHRHARVPEQMSLSQYLSEDSPIVRESEVSRAMKRRSVNINMHKSLKILDDAVGTPQHVTRAPRTPGSLRHSTYTPLRIPANDTLDVSAMFGTNNTSLPGASLLATPRPMHTTQMEEDITTTNVALLLEEDPGLAACTGLFTDFSDVMKENAALHQVFHLVDTYESRCKDNLNQLNKLVNRAVPGQTRFAKTVEMIRQLTQEAATWSLISSLYHDRLEQEVKGHKDEPMVLDNTTPYQSEQDLVIGYYEREGSVRQAQLVVDWLEKMAQDQLEIYHNVEFFTDDMGAWENTHHMLKQKKNGVSTGSDRPIVTQIDPDAPMRQGRPLADLDQEDEARLLKNIFAFVRAGNLEKAQKLCVKVGQAWRAAALEGWRLFHDPNHKSLGPDGRMEKVTGNPQRDIWKAVCWKMSAQEKLSNDERAIYAAFSGNLKQLLPVCTSWEDHLWAYFRVMADQLVEQEIRVNGNTKRPLVDIPANYWDKMLTVEKIFNDIQASSNQEVCQEAAGRFNIIQKYIILGDTDHLIEELYEWCKDEGNLPSQHLLRFMAHLVLFFRAVGVSTKEELCVSILEAYVHYLIEDRQSHLVATYVATLPLEMQVEWYAKFLEGVHDTEQRKTCLILAEEAGLDIPNITKLVVENIRSRDSSDFNGDGDTPSDIGTSKEDRQKIEAIDWLVFDPSQRAEALRQANAVMRAFLAMRKLSAAREVFNKIPAGSIDVIIKTWHAQTGSTDLRPEDDNAIREYLCHQAYLDSHDGFNDWFEHYHNAKPAKPQIATGANFTERVAFEHKEKQYEMDVARWKHNLLMQTKTTKDKLYNVLLFVDGGWMVDQRLDGPRDDNRTHQMRLLRQLCLPVMCYLLHTVLQNTEQYRECIQLADLIASEQYHLYKTFRRDELQQLLHKIRETSVSLLDSGLDPLGYAVTDGGFPSNTG